MKKYKFLVMLLILVGLAASCNQDSIGLQNSDGNQVSLTVNIGETETLLKSVPDTRATGDLQLTGYSLRYILEVWDEEDAIAYREERLVTDADETVDFEFSLPDEGDYDALLWADYINDDAELEGGHYADLYYETDATDGLKAVNIIGDAYAINTSSRDAFSGTISFTKGSTQTDIGTVTLRRPFGRINIIEKDAAMQAELTSLDLAYVVPATFNVMDGTVSDTYSASIIGIASFPAAATEKANLFFDYIFAPSTGQQLLGEIEMSYTATFGSGTFTIPANIPVERNKRTNISGSILTDPSITGLSVEIDDAWTDPDIDVSPIATVGSYYYEGGLFSDTYVSSLTCLGIVFEVDATGEHGKIISLDQSSDLAWYPLTNPLIGADSEDDGAGNTAKIKARPNATDFLAFRWCFNKGDGWYMPAIGELETFKAVWDTDFDGFNAKLTAAGGTAMDSDARYWSSTETAQNTAFQLSYEYGRANALKSNENLVRAMMAF